MGRFESKTVLVTGGGGSIVNIASSMANTGTPYFAAYTPEPFAIPRVGEPGDVTRLVLFVTSDDAAYATGSEFVVDGGLLLGPALQYEALQREALQRETEGA